VGFLGFYCKLFFLPAEQAENDIYPEKSDDDRTLRLFSFVMLFLITLSRKLAKQRCRARLRRFESCKPLNESKLPEFVTGKHLIWIKLAFLRENDFYPAQNEFYPAQRQGKTRLCRVESEVYPLAETPKTSVIRLIAFARLHVAIGPSSAGEKLCVLPSRKKPIFFGDRAGDAVTSKGSFLPLK
jgi:hypothetical protein